MADLGFDGKVAIITGAGGGLGREHALSLAKRGALRGRQRPRRRRRRLGQLGRPGPDGGRRDQGGRWRRHRRHQLGGDARGRRGDRADGDRRLRARRHRHQQRRHPARQDLPQHDAGPPRPGAGRPPQGCVQRDQAGVGAHPRAAVREGDLDLVSSRRVRQLRADQLRRRQDGPRRADPGARRRGRSLQHPGQRHRPARPDPDDRGHHGQPRREVEPRRWSRRSSRTSPTSRARRPGASSPSAAGGSPRSSSPRRPGSTRRT